MIPPGEFEFLRALLPNLPQSPEIAVGPGDDAAVLTPLPRGIVLSTDMLTDGTDFILSEIDLRRAGAKAVLVNLSDLAAMASRPVALLVALAVPQGPQSRELAEAVMFGARDAAAHYGVPIVGGDTNTWPHPLVICVTAIGEETPRKAVRRSGARVGDWVFVTGPLGGSIRGRHLSPVPRLAEAMALHQFAELHAMADISDGFAQDLGHVLTASRVGVVIDAGAVPVHPDAALEAARTGRTPLDHALTDGEDFELVFTTSATDGERLVASPPAPVWKVGECVPEAEGRWLVGAEGRRELGGGGFAHGFGGDLTPPHPSPKRRGG